MNIDKITEDLLMEQSLPPSFSKGIDYFKAGAVSRIQYSVNRITARVRGRSSYKVVIDKISDNPKFFCNCAYSMGGICKHCVAVGLAVIDSPETVEIIETAKDSIDKLPAKADDLLKQATSEQKDTFLRNCLDDHPDLLDQFEIFIRGQIAVESRIKVPEIAKRVRQKLKKIDLQNMEILYEYGDRRKTDYGYRENWEFMSDAGEELIADALGEYRQKIKKNMNDGNIIDAVKWCLGLIQGILYLDYEEIPDPYNCFYDGVEGHLRYEAIDSLKALVKSLSQKEMADNVIGRIADIFFSDEHLVPLRRFHDEDKCTMGIFRDFILELIRSRETALYIGQKINLLKLESKDETVLKMKIAAMSGKGDDWLAIAEKSYRLDPSVTRDLLEYYAKSTFSDKFYEVAGFAIKEWSSKFDEYLYGLPQVKEDERLYMQVLSDLTLRTEDISLFREFKKRFSDSEVKELIDKAKKSKSFNHFWITLLAEEKEYQTILNYVKKDTCYGDLDEAIQLILNVYPDECLAIISERASRALKDHMGRRLYQEVAHWLSHLKKINKKDTRHRARIFIQNILITYNNRSALKDEFNKFGLLDI